MTPFLNKQCIRFSASSALYPPPPPSMELTWRRQGATKPPAPISYRHPQGTATNLLYKCTLHKANRCNWTACKSYRTTTHVQGDPNQVTTHRGSRSHPATGKTVRPLQAPTRQPDQREPPRRLVAEALASPALTAS